jgi:hypothetical protein
MSFEGYGIILSLLEALKILDSVTVQYRFRTREVFITDSILGETMYWYRMHVIFLTSKATAIESQGCVWKFPEP